ncbi:uncharacterized protein at4g10930 [Phtheirospermum japonicum]|uniref:Uncharacterized protein at4g10930 n=1 Tax=Phtheirospermum japonicum TaxID=374723 RepID=A0A830BB75_9LAMI|nr:uncharacterized protein at4g10930 [Phtheirospermum japonicum]
MELDFITDETSDEENYGFDDASEDYLNIEGERCGICMDVVIDRGVLDCCQHWYVYDTVGGNKTDDDTNLRDDDWFIEGKSNTLSFPSYYIDENAVVCLDGDDCKIRSGSVTIEEDSDIDTSIACDSCDRWYHAYCVGFDPEGNCDSSWLCPRCCTLEKGPNEPDSISLSRKSYQNVFEVAGDDCLAEASFSGRVSVSVADDGETAVVISMLDDENQESQESSQLAVGCSKDMGNTLLLPSSESSLPNSSHAILPAELISDTPGTKDNEIAEDKVCGLSKPDHRPENLIPAEKMVPNDMEVSSLNNTTPDEKPGLSRITATKRKHRDSRNVDGGREANIEDRISRKKVKADKNSQPISTMNQTAASDLSTISRQSISRDTTLRRTSGKEKGTSDIMAIVQGTDRRSLKQSVRKNSSDITLKERETAAGLRLKKIMRRPDDDKDSSVLVQELRKKIRDAVRNKSSEEQNLFDPKLLDAFRAALAGSGAENQKPALDVRAKRSLLQKGKIRESLTKKIYGAGGKRKRAWTRECEVEFWKHRCVKTSKPEKIQALKSVLDVLRDNTSDRTKKMAGNEEEAKGSVLSRLYLADNSVFPRKNDIKPVSVPQPSNQSDTNPQKRNILYQLKVPNFDGKETNKSVKGVKSETASKGAPSPAIGGKKIPLEKDKATKPETVKGDKRQWALEGQLPKEMRPVLAPSRHNKIPASVRQTQLYRLTEHFLKKANVSVAFRTAETELAVADAVNIEKQVADRSNSKLVYLNLCSQELSRRSDDMNLSRPKEVDPCSTSDCLSDGAIEENNNNNNNNNNSSFDLGVDEALKRAGLVSDSPPSSPNHPMEDINDNKIGSVENSDDEGPENIFEVESHSELDIYGDFEYNLEDDDFIGAGALYNTSSKPQPEPPKLKLLFSSLKPEKPDEIVGPEALDNSSGPLESQNETCNGGLTVDGGKDECVVRDSSVDNDEEELSMAECEELYGPDKEPLIEKCPEILSVTPFGQMVKKSGQSSGDCAGSLETGGDGSKQSPYNSQQKENVVEKEKKDKSDTKRPEQSRVEAYIKEHIRPLCKSGVITVEQYRWAVGKTTEKVMKYHSKEKNANFLIKEGEKVKKLAEQYVETSQQKAKT